VVFIRQEPSLQSGFADATKAFAVRSKSRAKRPGIMAIDPALAVVALT